MPKIRRFFQKQNKAMFVFDGDCIDNKTLNIRLNHFYVNETKLFIKIIRFLLT